MSDKSCVFHDKLDTVEGNVWFDVVEGVIFSLCDGHKFHRQGQLSNSIIGVATIKSTFIK